MRSPQSSNSTYPLTGQQVMMQLDQVTSRMMDLTTQETQHINMDTENSQQHPQTQQTNNPSPKCVMWQY